MVLMSVWRMNWNGGDPGVRESHQEAGEGIWARDGSVLNQENSRGEEERWVDLKASMAFDDRLDVGMQGKKGGIWLVS